MRAHYLQILGLDSEATEEDIKKAYRNKSKKYHPDVNPSEDAAEVFLKVQEAYEYLTGEPELHEYFQEEEEELSEREKWRILARQRAKERAIEKERYQQELVKKVVKYFTPVAVFIVLLNVILAIDFTLPYKRHEQKILDKSMVFITDDDRYYSREYRYDDMTFSDYTMRFDRNEVMSLNHEDEAVVAATFLLDIPMKVWITVEGETLEYRQIYNIYNVFGYLIPPMLLVGLLFFRLKKPMSRLNAAIVLFVFAVYQLVVLYF